MLPLRKWDTENYIELVNLLLQKFPTVRIIITGRQDEMAQSERFEERLTDKTRVINFCGKTSVRQLLTLYSRASLLIATDSGVAHFASITSIFSVVLFGPETPVLYQPLTRNSKVIYKNLPCSPCYNVYNNRVSPCRDNLCLKTITVTEVFAAVLKVIDS